MPDASPPYTPPDWFSVPPEPCEHFVTNQVSRDAHSHASAALTRQHTVTLHIYGAGKSIWKHKATLTDGTYSLINDKKLRLLIGFPLMQYSVYDPAIRRFVPVPTFANLEVRDRQIIVLRYTKFDNLPNGNFPGLSELIHRCNAWYTNSIMDLYPETISGKKRKTSSTPPSRRSKRIKTEA